MSWTHLVGFAAYILAEAWKQERDENREKNHQLTHQPRKQLNNGQFNGGSNNDLTDCYEEIESEVCDERF